MKAVALVAVLGAAFALTACQKEPTPVVVEPATPVVVTPAAPADVTVVTPPAAPAASTDTSVPVEEKK